MLHWIWIARLRAALRLFGGFSRRALHDAELDEEMRFHIEKATERNVRRGMSPDAARRAALLAFGGQTQWTEAARDEQRSAWLHDFVRDIRYGLGSLRRNRAFAVSAILTLALGLGATISVFGFINSVYLRPLAVPEGPRLVRVAGVVRQDTDRSLGIPAYNVLKAAAKSFDFVAAHYSTAPLYLTARGESEEIEGAVVSGEYFPMLGIHPALGRFFLPSEDSIPNRDAVVVLGHGLWLSRFDGDRGVIGERVTINDRAFTVVGVAPDGFTGVVGGMINRLWIPMAMLQTGYRWCDGFQASCAITSIVARRAPGVTLERARAEVSSMIGSITAVTDRDASIRAIATEPIVGIREHEQQRYMSLSKLLAAIAIILMGVACANLSGLLLARGLSRRREIALRTSLGASRWRVARQLLTENLLIAGAGGTLGVLLSLFAARALAGFFDADNEGYAYAHRYDVTFDWHVAAFAALASIVAVVIFGLTPAMRSSRVDLAETLKNGGDRATSSRARARMVLVAAQVVLSIALLVGAGLLTRSFSRLMSGAAFDPSHVAQIRLRPRLMGYGPDSGQRYLRRVIGAIRATPGVVAAAPVRGSLVNMMTGSATIARPGDAPIARERAPRVDYFDIGPDYFKALGVPMIAGREFTDRDDAAAPLVALVSESLAQRTWHEGKAVGRLLLLNGRQFRVVGVVRDHRVLRFGESTVPTAYVSFWQSAFEEQVDARVAIRVNGDPLRALPAIRRAAESADPRVPVTENQSMSRQMSATFVQVRLGRAVLIASAALALVLSAIGLYGVIAFLVGQRRREIGVRIAVGARPIDVVTLFVRQGLRPIWIGVAGGLGVSVAGAPLLSQWLFGIPPVDPISMVAATTAVAFAAVLASYVPARRAARTDPAAVFRCE